MKVMNVKFVGRIIMTILFVFICIGAYAGDDLLKYEIEGEGVGVQGTYLVKVTVIQKKSKLDIDVIKKCAVHGVLYPCGNRTIDLQRLLRSERRCCGCFSERI